MTAERYHVRVTNDAFIFSGAHIKTIDRDKGERLHGHNYRVAVEVEGPLDENHYVFDFIALRDRTQMIAAELDHHVLLATQNPLLPVEVIGDRVRVTFGPKEWLFPREDCILLPIGNTTAELLAKWIAGRLLADLRGRGFAPQVLRVEVEENIGQAAIYESRA